MAYIRLEALVKELEENPFTMSMCMTVDECKGMNRARSLIAEVVKAIPAEDVQPVVHGKWIFDCERRQGDGWIYKQRHCSACGFQTVECLNYCQKCGAKMDLEG